MKEKMKERVLQIKNKITEYWSNRTLPQKLLIIGGSVLVLALIITVTLFTTKTDYAPLYSNLSPEEAGQIKETLDSRGIPSIVSNDGTISVPEDQVNNLKVELAAEGLPKSGKIDYSFFKERAGFGMTENEFNVLERGAIQTELENLIKSIEGVKDANVMITLPNESIWVAQEDQTSSASVVLNLAPGKELEEKEIKALYNLVEKSIPNLPKENIVIMDQFFNYYDINTESDRSGFTLYEQQRQIKKDIERDIQRQIQQMLTTIIGPGKVVSSVTADIDFTQENREENLVEPVDIENMEGLQVSVERIRESFTGDAAGAEGVAGTGETDIPEYPAVIGGQNGEYERDEERINNEFNRIRKEIVESPYKIRDLGIQVMVEPPDPEDPASLDPQTINDIENVLSSIIRTTISKDAETPMEDEDIEEKIHVSAQTFHGKPNVEEEEQARLPIWLYIVGGVLLAIILILAYLLYRRKKEDEYEEVEELAVGEEAEEEDTVPDLEVSADSEEQRRLKQIEKLADEKPEDFVKLLRTWLSEE